MPSATVSGTVSGPLDAFAVSGITNGTSMAELRHNTTKLGTYTLLVSNVTRHGITYDLGWDCQPIWLPYGTRIRACY